MVDIIGVTKGKGYKGVVTRSQDPQGSQQGCLYWCLASGYRVTYTVARAGQNQYHHRTEMNKKVYKIVKAGEESHDASTEFDRTEKEITAMGGILITSYCQG
ncbi:unnamed protein product [Urochloa humidicola]